MGNAMSAWKVSFYVTSLTEALELRPCLPVMRLADRTSEQGRKLQRLAMEMRARESVNMSEDLTGAIPPYATALHDTFLHSHCSSCFSKLPPQPPCVMSCTMCCSVRYCCSECLGTDSVVHSSSGECCFFVDHLKRASPNYVTEGTSDLRAALRLLYVLEMHGLVSSDSIKHYSRIGGLSASGIEETLEDGEEIAERILEGSLLMLSARKSRAQTYVSFSDGLKVERMALWAVITNSVEVQLSEGLAMGTAVYGPSFSWFNHSCFPNASYRFVLALKNEDCISHKSKSCAVPASKGVAADVVRKLIIILKRKFLVFYWSHFILIHLSCHARNISFQEARHSDLWLKYKFICSCNRCIASPEPYVDLILNRDARDLNKPEDAVAAPRFEDLDDDLQQAISEYSSGNDVKACCDMIESMLSENLMRDLQKGALSGRKHILHPLHRVCFNAYMALASAYRFRALSLKTVSLHGEKSDDVFRMAKAAAAYSLLLAGATNHLFLSECSFMMPLSHFLIGAGQSLFFLVESMKGEMRQYLSEAKFAFPSCPESSAKHDPVTYNEFRSTCEGFGKQMLSLSFHCWSFLVQGLPCLEMIKNPIDFSWLGTAIFQFLLSEEDYSNLSAHDPTSFTNEQKECILSLAICSVTYCKYLTSICYGPQHYLADHANDILEGIDIVHDLSFSYKSSGADEGGYNKSSTDDYGSADGYNKSSTDDYGSGGGYTKSSTDDYGSGGGFNKSSTDDYGSEGGYNKSSTDDYGNSGGYNKSDDLSSDYNKSGTDDYSGSGGYNNSNTSDEYKKPSSDDYGGDNKDSSTDGYGGSGYNKSSTDNYEDSGKNTSNTDNYSGSGGYDKSSSDDYGRSGKSGTDDYSGGYDKKSGSDDGGDDGYNRSGGDDYGSGGYNKSGTDDDYNTSGGGYKKSFGDDEYTGGGDGYNKSSGGADDEYGSSRDDSEKYRKEEKEHKHKEHLGETGALGAGAFALYERHEAKKDPEHAQRHKIEEGVAAVAALGGGGLAFHEHHDKKEAKDEAEDAEEEPLLAWTWTIWRGPTASRELVMAEKKHHHHLFHHRKEEESSDEVDYEKKEKQHKHMEQLGELGAIAAGAYALHEKHKAKKDPENEHGHRIKEEVAAVAAVGSAGFAFHEHHEKKDAKKHGHN
ncbi:Protein SET DOMAIN GROUP 41 [Dichanthelium oligosanthes]|uniref:Protein SET DOMAIN GROUP 41 n=1 Tax=Dichanthelium oligosanthes TaxID=888268 RepID=A0A1E5UVG1_9POAL|nr:Protein SET DOMAIN GROUP 41 [Dichanthelium oligosanthes]